MPSVRVTCGKPRYGPFMLVNATASCLFFLAIVKLTSIEQNIHNRRVWIKTSALNPIPNAKYIPMYFPAWRLPPLSPFSSDQCFNQTLPPMINQYHPFKKVYTTEEKRHGRQVVFAVGPLQHAYAILRSLNQAKKQPQKQPRIFSLPIWAHCAPIRTSNHIATATEFALDAYAA